MVIGKLLIICVTLKVRCSIHLLTLENTILATLWNFLASCIHGAFQTLPQHFSPYLSHLFSVMCLNQKLICWIGIFFFFLMFAAGKEHHLLLTSSFHLPLGLVTGSVPGIYCHAQHAVGHTSLDKKEFAK